MYKGGVYDDDEVYAALLHAQAIARVAKKRMRHLEEEERAEKKGGFCEADLEEKTDEAVDKQVQAAEEEQEKAERDMQRMRQLMEQYERDDARGDEGACAAGKYGRTFRGDGN